MITKQMLHDKIVELVSKYPNGKYIRLDSTSSRCYYNRGQVENGPDTEGCIFGQAIRELDPEFFAKEGSSFLDIRAFCKKYLGFEPSEILQDMQAHQDDDMPWGQAWELANASRDS